MFSENHLADGTSNFFLQEKILEAKIKTSIFFFLAQKMEYLFFFLLRYDMV